MLLYQQNWAMLFKDFHITQYLLITWSLAIEEQLELGEDGLEEEDKYLLEIKLDDLGSTSGEVQHYWLLAIRSARQAYSLRRQQPTEEILDHG